MKKGKINTGHLKVKIKNTKEEKMLAIYHVVKKNESFEESAKMLFDMLKTTQEQKPNQKRALYLDIEGHKTNKGGYDAEMIELQVDFVAGMLGKWFTKVSMPLATFTNPNQRNDIPKELKIEEESLS